MWNLLLIACPQAISMKSFSKLIKNVLHGQGLCQFIVFIEDNHLLSFFNHNNIINYYICSLIGYNRTKIFFKLKFKTFFIALFLHTTPQAAKLLLLLLLLLL